MIIDTGMYVHCRYVCRICSIAECMHDTEYVGYSVHGEKLQTNCSLGGLFGKSPTLKLSTYLPMIPYHTYVHTL